MKIQVFAAAAVTIAVLVGIGWSALKHDAEVETQWMRNCVQSGFSQKQCEVLWSVKASSDSAAGLAAGAMGASIGAAAIRR